MAEPDGAAEFCRRAYPQLVGTMAVYCGDRGVAEELAQETLLRVWDRWERVRDLESPMGWAHRVALNLARSWFRRRAAERRALARHGAPPEQGPALPDDAEVLALRGAVRGLPPRQRAAVALRYYAGLSVAEAADVLGCAEGTVKSLTAKGVATLRAGIGRDEDAAITGRTGIQEVRGAC